MAQLTPAEILCLVTPEALKQEVVTSSLGAHHGEVESVDWLDQYQYNSSGGVPSVGRFSVAELHTRAV